jgi:hypothetical protein
VEDIVTYESFIPLVFALKLPTRVQAALENAEEACNHDDHYCSLRNELLAIYKSMGDEIIWNQSPTRQRRYLGILAGFGAGFFLRPAISKFTGGLFGDGDEWKDKFNEVS